MKKSILGVIAFLCITSTISAQTLPTSFGKGIQISSQDSSFYIRFGFRFQTLFTNDWTVGNDELNELENYKGNILIRRSRFKFDGFAFHPSLKYKFEMGISNRDIGGGSAPEFRNGANLILDAYVDWNFYRNLKIKFGQFKLPGNRERVISSANLQMVDRSRLNSRYNIDRDVGFVLSNSHTLGERFILREMIAFTKGEGRNVTIDYQEGYNYTFRLEALPFGSFESKGDYVGAAIKKEETPKLSIGASYEMNNNAVRERGQLGSFIVDNEGNYHGKDLNTAFIDLMFKYKNFSLMAEYAHKDTEDGEAALSVNNEVIGTYFIGQGINVQAGYMLRSNWEISGRWTQISPNEGSGIDETEYTLGLSKYVKGHKLKVQSDISYRAKEELDDGLSVRLQMDVHF